MNAFKLECKGGRVYVGICNADRDAMQQQRSFLDQYAPTEIKETKTFAVREAALEYMYDWFYEEAKEIGIEYVGCDTWPLAGVWTDEQVRLVALFYSVRRDTRLDQVQRKFKYAFRLPPPPPKRQYHVDIDDFAADFKSSFGTDVRCLRCNERDHRTAMCPLRPKNASE